MLGPEENYPRHHEVQVRGAKGAGEAPLWMLVVADRDQVDVRGAVDLRAGEKKDVDSALAGGVEELAPSVREGVVGGNFLQRDKRRSVSPVLRKQSRGRGKRRIGAHGHVPRLTNLSRQRINEDFFRPNCHGARDVIHCVEKVPTARGNPENPVGCGPAANTRGGAGGLRGNARRGQVARLRAAPRMLLRCRRRGWYRPPSLGPRADSPRTASRP